MFVFFRVAVKALLSLHPTNKIPWRLLMKPQPQLHISFAQNLVCLMFYRFIWEVFKTDWTDSFGQAK